MSAAEPSEQCRTHAPHFSAPIDGIVRGNSHALAQARPWLRRDVSRFNAAGAAAAAAASGQSAASAAAAGASAASSVASNGSSALGTSPIAVSHGGRSTTTKTDRAGAMGFSRLAFVTSVASIAQRA